MIWFNHSHFFFSNKKQAERLRTFQCHSASYGRVGSGNKVHSELSLLPGTVSSHTVSSLLLPIASTFLMEVYPLRCKTDMNKSLKRDAGRELDDK